MYKTKVPSPQQWYVDFNNRGKKKSQPNFFNNILECDRKKIKRIAAETIARSSSHTSSNKLVQLRSKVRQSKWILVIILSLLNRL